MTSGTMRDAVFFFLFYVLVSNKQYVLIQTGRHFFLLDLCFNFINDNFVFVHLKTLLNLSRIGTQKRITG